MKIADVPPSAVEALKAGLDQYVTSLGRVRLPEKGIAPANLNARGALAEARLGLEDVKFFLRAQGDALEAFFNRLRVLLFGGETPIGSAGLLRADSGSFTVEHVTLGGADDIVDGLTKIEEFLESNDSEARLIQIPQIYLSSLVLIRNGIFGPFLVLTPPYPEAVAARTPDAFRHFVGQLLEEHQRLFPPG